MKVIISIILTLAIFFSLSWWNIQYLTKTSDELIKHAENLREALHEENWDSIDSLIMETRHSWGRQKKTWLLLLDHQEIDDIDRALYRIDEMIKLREKTQALSDLAEFRFHIQDITDKESFSLANIF